MAKGTKPATAKRAALSETEDDLEIMWVISGREDEKVAFRERNDAHPCSGEAFVAGTKPVPVAMTKQVEIALREGTIIEASREEIDAIPENQLPKIGKAPGSSARERRGRQVAKA